MSTQDDEDPIQRARRLRSAAVALRQSLHQAAERLHLARTALAEQQRQRVDPDRVEGGPRATRLPHDPTRGGFR
ncbi:hypothetical protein AVKW3434_22540 [Acidovorax sp. SUPP3434]|uniref:hypothetical protein n=1 Tax=Acidovorax sp. SUPP3434 TaxID=2920880 RepID=UPI0023DE22F5|nr:hypothetical protein [Acidovorax sp. SUPP3434]GKT02219.1 hypothetical protein AVKW3434_22540 [Acidovorax sp. SUPP3434]